MNYSWNYSTKGGVAKCRIIFYWIYLRMCNCKVKRHWDQHTLGGFVTGGLDHSKSNCSNAIVLKSFLESAIVQK